MRKLILGALRTDPTLVVIKTRIEAAWRTAKTAQPIDILFLSQISTDDPTGVEYTVNPYYIKIIVSQTNPPGMASIQQDLKDAIKDYSKLEK
jgi:hypothetical protein